MATRDPSIDTFDARRELSPGETDDVSVVTSHKYPALGETGDDISSADRCGPLGSQIRFLVSIRVGGESVVESEKCLQRLDRGLFGSSPVTENWSLPLSIADEGEYDVEIEFRLAGTRELLDTASYVLVVGTPSDDPDRSVYDGALYVPRRVTVGETATIAAQGCCVGDKPCRQSAYGITVTGPDGFKEFVVNSIEYDGGECNDLSFHITPPTAGTYTAKLTVADNSWQRQFEAVTSDGDDGGDGDGNRRTILALTAAGAGAWILANDDEEGELDA